MLQLTRPGDRVLPNRRCGCCGQLGLSQDGPGTTWVDDLSLERVDASVPLTGRRPVARKTAGNMDFEDSGTAIAPWLLTGSGQDAFQAVVVQAPVHGGRHALALRPASARPRGYGVVLQAFSAEPFRNKRVRISGYVRSEGVVARGDFWARAQGSDSPADGPGLDGAFLPLEADADWTRYVVVFDVAPEAVELQIGAGIQGPGTLFLDDLQVEVVDTSVPLAPALPAAPVNLHFEE